MAPEVIADEAVSVGEHESEAPRVKEESAEARIDDAFEKHVDRLPRSGEARLEKHEAGLHEEYEERRDDGPHRIDRVDVRRSWRCGGGRRLVRESGREEVRRDALHDGQAQQYAENLGS
jgi:hypothetical protein